jgi:hypothetical protein
VGQKKGPLPSGSRPVVSMNVLTQPGAPPERLRLRLTLRLAMRGVIMAPHYYALQRIRQARARHVVTPSAREGTKAPRPSLSLDSLRMMS